MRTEGRHMVVEVSGCNPDVLNDLDRVKEILRESALQANAEILELAFHHFTPQGVSGVVVISESHLSIHTWPEYGYAALDVYTCGEKTDPWRAMEYAAEKFEATTIVKTEIARGQEIEGRPGVYGHSVVESEVMRDGVAVVS
ncbi:MAG TPA: adenosylmethionine decarboxylase [Clostridia bacterium]|nr:adenosylmethionine decarboxylase [Clostridia bacterium]